MREDRRKKPLANDASLRQVYLYLTEGCNLACRHCWLEPKRQTGRTSYPSLPLELARDILEQARGLDVAEIKLTGGEPFLHPGIGDILELIRRLGFRLAIETNGALCSWELATKVADCHEPFISVSLDASDAVTHDWIRGVQGSFEACLEGIRNLVRAGLRPQIIMSVMRRNKELLEPVVRLAESLGVGSVKFNLVQPSGRGRSLEKRGETLTVEELLEIGRWVESTLETSTSLELYYDKPIAFLPLNRIFGGGGEGYAVCKILHIIGVLPDGSYALCGIGAQVPELVFGHAARDHLADVWRSSPALVALREGIPHRLEGICSHCVVRNLCLGGCIAQNYYRRKSLWAPFWFCEEAFDKGLFPSTRYFEVDR